MLAVKQRFEANDAGLSQIEQFVHDRLRKEGLSTATATNSTNLMLSIARLMAGRGPGFLGVSVQRSGGALVLRLVSDGSAYNPLEDLDLRTLLDRDPPLPDDDFDTPLPREQLLSALRNNLSYYRRGNLNEIEFVAKRSKPQALRAVTGSFLLAIAVGLLLRFLGAEGLNQMLSTYLLTPLRTMFLNALKMLVVPVVFLSIAASISGVSDIREYGKIGAKVFGFYTCTSFLAILVGYGVYQLLQPGAGVLPDISAYSYSPEGMTDISLLDTVIHVIPSSFVGAFTGTDMLPVIFLALLIGIAASRLDHGEDRQKVTEFLGLCNRLFLKMASIVMLAIPVATFCSMTLLVLSIDAGMVLALIKLVGSMLLGLLGMFLIYGLLFFLRVRRNPLVFFRKCIPLFLSFITFCSTSAVMPQSLEISAKRLGISPKISSFSLPLGSTINMDGACIYLTLSVLFLAAVYQVPVTTDMLLKLAVTIVILSMGAPPISGAGFICLSILVMQIGLPMESLGILMGIDQLMSMCRTLINGAGDLVGTAIVASSEGLMDLSVFDQQE